MLLRDENNNKKSRVEKAGVGGGGVGGGNRGRDGKSAMSAV